MTQTIDEMIANVMPMAPVNPGAFSGIPQRPMGSGSITQAEMDAMMRAQMPRPEMRPTGSGSTTQQEIDAYMRSQLMRPEMRPTGSGSITQAEMDAMQRNMPEIDMTSQESMMNYLMEKIEQIRERTGRQPQEGMGALEALLKSLPRGQLDGMMPEGSMRDGQRTYFENQRFDNIDPGMARNVNPGMDQGMVRPQPMGMR
jgi:hypothetical protein